MRMGRNYKVTGNTYFCCFSGNEYGAQSHEFCKSLFVKVMQSKIVTLICWFVPCLYVKTKSVFSFLVTTLC